MSEHRMADPTVIPIAFAGPIIDAWSRTGNIGRLVRDAIANAKREKRMDDVTLYRAMSDQLADWFGQMR
jgi:hypothetical protein